MTSININNNENVEMVEMQNVAEENKKQAEIEKVKS